MLRSYFSILLTIIALSACSDGSPSNDVSAMDSALDIPFPNDVRLIDGGGDSGPLRWQCPSEWVPFAQGGCGPAVILCGPRGGAVDGTCNGVDSTGPRRIVDELGVTSTRFFRLPDGGIGGGWSIGPWGDVDPGSECPLGWTVSPDRVCAPNLSATCPANSAALPDGTCTETAEINCPTTAYDDPGAEALGAEIVHVRADAESSVADGSELYPFASIADGIANIAENGWILIAQGNYSESIVITRGVHLLGQCAAHVSIRSATTAATVAVSSSNLDLRGVRLSGTAGAIVATTGAHVRLRAVEIAGATGTSVDILGTNTSVDAQGVWIHDAQPLSGGYAGIGLQISHGASATLSRVVHSGNHDGLVISGSGTTAHIENSVLRDSLARYDNPRAAGLTVSNGASATAVDLVLGNNRGFGAVIDGVGSILAIEQSVVRDTQPLAATAPGIGIEVSAGGLLTAHALSLVGNRARSLDVSGTGSIANISESLVSATLPGLEGIEGYGLSVNTGGRIQASRMLIAMSTEGAVAAIPGAIQLNDVIIVGVAPSVRGFGFGITSNATSMIDGARVAVVDVHGAAIAATRNDSQVGAVGGTIRATDTFVQNVLESTVQIDPSSSTSALGPSVAYGLFGGTNTSIDAQNLVIDQGRYGFVDISGTLALRYSVVTGQSIAGALDATASSRAQFRFVQLSGNATDSIDHTAVLTPVVLGQ